MEVRFHSSSPVSHLSGLWKSRRKRGLGCSASAWRAWSASIVSHCEFLGLYLTLESWGYLTNSKCPLAFEYVSPSGVSDIEEWTGNSWSHQALFGTRTACSALSPERSALWKCLCFSYVEPWRFLMIAGTDCIQHNIAQTFQSETVILCQSFLKHNLCLFLNNLFVTNQLIISFVRI